MNIEPARFLFLLGAVPFLVLGVAHAWHTPTHPEERKGLSPRDPAVADEMRRTTPRLTDRTDVWRAWVGFNYSHSLGAVLFGCFVLLIGRNAASYALNGALAVPLALVTALAYLVLAVRYWFRTPAVGVGLSLACFLAAYLLG